jgi:hypothetical protein
MLKQIDTKCTYLALDTIRNSPITEDPYPHVVIDNFLRPEKLNAVCHDFPNIVEGGSFNLSQVNCQGAFARFIEELESPAFRDCVAAKFAMDLTDKPSLITLRGYSRSKDGRIHTDTKSKLITVLIYLNPEWSAASGKLRVLNSNQMEDYKVEVSPVAGTCLMFKVTDNCWHGYPAFEGTRRSIQLNFLENDAAINSHLLRHNISAKFKGLKNIFKSSDEY